MSDAWYLAADEYYVAPGEDELYPPRQGDVFASPGDDGWLACQLVHPTCEIAKESVREVQVIRVHALDELPSGQRARVVAGWEEKDGAIRIAFANTFFLPPVSALDPKRPLFANFREIKVIDKAALLADRVAAMTHEARVTFLRRHMYFQYRLAFSHQDVLAWEASRIAADPAFVGPRPERAGSSN